MSDAKMPERLLVIRNKDGSLPCGTAPVRSCPEQTEYARVDIVNANLLESGKATAQAWGEIDALRADAQRVREAAEELAQSYAALARWAQMHGDVEKAHRFMAALVPEPPAADCTGRGASKTSAELPGPTSQQGLAGRLGQPTGGGAAAEPPAPSGECATCHGDLGPMLCPECRSLARETHRSEGYAAGLAEGAKQERAAVVAWLRERHDAATRFSVDARTVDGLVMAYSAASHDIESAAHLRADEAGSKP